ncbi:MAG: N-glycosylase/DNA lyase [Blastocatellia bacterium]|nr:N-glycosylase/DNA lyase [Blastocatellia bacterium]
MQRTHQPVTIENIRATHEMRLDQIRRRLGEFRDVWRDASDERIWEEMVYCIFTAGSSARMGLNAVEAVRHLIHVGTREEMTEALKGKYRYIAARPGYIIVTRDYLQEHCGFRLRNKLASFSDPIARRDWLAGERRVKGLGYKEASHFLRNIGIPGYAILDKHILRCLSEVGVIDSPKPPSTRLRYIEIEKRFRAFAQGVKIDFDELDLVLWSMRTGEILK